MIKPDSYVKQLLYDHDCVVIPNFGGFILRESPAQYQALTHQIKPSTRSVFFNSGLTQNDGLLAKTIAENLGKSYNEAHDMLNEWVSHANKEITLNSRLKFGQIGTFFVNAEGKKWFAPNATLNFSKDTFGLEPITLAPLNVESKFEKPITVAAKTKETFKEVDKVIPIKKSKSKVWLKVAAVVLIGGCIGIASFYINTEEVNFFNKEQNASMTFIPDSGKEKQAIVQEEIASDELTYTEPTEETLHVEEGEIQTLSNYSEEEEFLEEITETPIIEDELSGEAIETGNFTILAGAFLYENNAQNQLNKLIEKGFETNIFKPEYSKLTRIYIGSFNDKASAEETLNKVKPIVPTAYIIEK